MEFNRNEKKKYVDYFSIGYGVEKNLEKSIKYYKMAADEGDQLAMISYASMLSENEKGAFDEKVVIKYYQKALNLGENVNLESYLMKAKNIYSNS